MRERSKLIARLEACDPKFDGILTYEIWQDYTSQLLVSRTSHDLLSTICSKDSLPEDKYFGASNIDELLAWIVMDLGHSTPRFLTFSLAGWFCADGGEHTRLIVNTKSSKAFILRSSISKAPCPEDIQTGRFKDSPEVALQKYLRNLSAASGIWSSVSDRWVADCLTLAIATAMIERVARSRAA
ncbi:MAG: hypothetical protein NTV34_11430 [Proteobacteria bacterium]|nr:hypothetical protein [Pseudomonadota bacterium]